MEIEVYALYNTELKLWVRKKTKYMYNQNYFTKSFDDARIYAKKTDAFLTIKFLKEDPKNYELHTLKLSTQSKEGVDKAIKNNKKKGK